MAQVRARVVVLNDRNELALIARHTPRADYFTLPGGGVEEGEASHEAAVREIQEELGLDVQLEDYLGLAGDQEVFLARVTGRPKLHLSGPELAKSSKENTYTPVWRKLKDVDDLRVHSRAVKQLLQHYIPLWNQF